MRKVRFCSVRKNGLGEACPNKHYAGSYCKKHYTQVARHGRLTPERERGIVRICLVEGCERADTIGQHCRKHARQIRTHGRLTPEREHQMGNVGCRVPGCPNKHRAKGYCVKHYNQMRWQKIKRQLARIKELEARVRATATTAPETNAPPPDTVPASDFAGAGEAFAAGAGEEE